MPRPAPCVDPDEVDLMIIAHCGDTRAALAKVMAEAADLRHELALASVATSYGFTRGWKPKVTS